MVHSRIASLAVSGATVSRNVPLLLITLTLCIRYVNNQRDKAIDTLTTWHGNGNPQSAWVTLQTREYEEFLNMNGASESVLIGDV
jgi:hypothetical protein